MPQAVSHAHKTNHTKQFLDDALENLAKEGAEWLVGKVVATLYGNVAGAVVSTGIDIVGVINSLASSSTGMVYGGSQNVFIEKKMAARAGMDTILCNLHSFEKISQGDSKVFINGQPAVRVGDMCECGSVAIEGSSKVYFNGNTINCGKVKEESSASSAINLAYNIAKASDAQNSLKNAKNSIEKASKLAEYTEAVQDINSFNKK